MKPSDISIKDEIYKLAVPERARALDKNDYNLAFKQFVELFGQKFDDIKANADSFPRLVDVDTCPATLLPFLGGLIGFDYDYTSDAETQREQMKTLVKYYREKGTEASILDIVYKYDPLAVLYEPHEHMARWNISRHSGRMPYPNRSYWNTGVFEIRLSAGDSRRMRDEVLKLRPAGTRIWFHYENEVDPGDGGGFVTTTEPVFVTVGISLALTHPDALSGTLRGNRAQLSGSTEARYQHEIASEAEADGRRYYDATSPVYTWDEVLEQNPSADTSDPIDSLGSDVPVSFAYPMEAVYPAGTFEVDSTHTQFGVQQEADGRHEEDGLEATAPTELGIVAARRTLAGSPLYSVNRLYGDELIAYDHFNRPDGSTVGTAPSGHVWQMQGTQTWGIQNNELRPISPKVNEPLYIDIGRSDNVAMQCKIAKFHSNMTILWRFTGSGINYLLVQGQKVYRCENNVFTKYFEGLGIVDGDILRIEVRGKRNMIFVNNVMKFAFTEARFLTATRFGFSANEGTARFDDFTIERLPVGQALVYDDFERPDTTNTIGTSTSGHAWQIYGTQTWKINTGRLLPVTPAYDSPVYLDPGIADNVAFICAVSTYHFNMQFMWRFTGTAISYFLIEDQRVWRADNGAYTLLFEGLGLQTGSLLRVELRGDHHQIFVDGVLKFQFRDAAYQNATKFGVGAINSSPRFDDFRVERLPVPGPVYGGETLLFDDFNRPDDTTTIGTSTSGHTWQMQGTQVWGIENNTLRPVSPQRDYCMYLDAGRHDYVALEVQLTTTDPLMAVMWRIDDSGGFDYFMLQGDNLYRVIDYNFTWLADTFGIVDGSVLRVELRGAEHQIWVDGLLKFTFTDETHRYATGFGVNAANGVPRFDNFRLTSLASSPAVPHIDSDLELTGPHTTVSLREPTVGSFIEYQDDVHITITN